MLSCLGVGKEKPVYIKQKTVLGFSNRKYRLLGAS